MMAYKAHVATLTLDALNGMGRLDFARLLGGIFERSP